MTVSSQTNRASFLGNGSTTSFPISFPFQAQADLVVLLTTIADGTQTTQTLNSDFTISGTTDAQGFYPSGGTVTFATAPASTKSITIYRDPAATQTVAYVDNSPLPAADLQSPMDKLTMLVQRVKDLISRSLTQPDGDTTTIGRMPAKVNRASMFLAFDSNGDPIAAAGTSADLTPVSTFVNGILDAADAATFQTDIGLTPGIAAGDIVKLDSNGKIPAVDGSQITGSPGWKTGMAVLTLQDTADTGWVMFDDGTIGDASSGATNRANADTSALFALIWAKINNTNCPIQDSSGTASTRGATAAADFAAHKRMPLPKALGHVLGVAGAGSGLTSRSLGDTVGAETHTLAKTEIPKPTNSVPVQNSGTAGTFGAVMLGTAQSVVSTTLVTDDFATSPTAVSLMQPTTFFNVMVKL